MRMKSTSKATVAVLRIWLLSLIAVCGCAMVANAQSFSSGSDGSDGPLDAASLGVITTPATVIFNPASFPGDQHSLNIFNFSTIDIPAGVTVRLSSTNINGPVYFLASGNVDIEGTIDISGMAAVAVSPNLDGRRRALAGAGGYDGGVGGENDASTTNTSEPVAQPGDGPGGGAAGTFSSPCVNVALPGAGGAFSGNKFLVPLVGGSGGGGGLMPGSLGSVPYGTSGGAGGGALLLASSSTIIVNGTINANGGAAGNGGGTQGYGDYCGYLVPAANGYGGGGSGGAIRLAGNTISGSGAITAAGGSASTTCNGHCSNAGGNGLVRIEAFSDNFTGTVTGTEVQSSPFSTFAPSTPTPSVSVISVGTVTLPPVPTASLTTPDATIQTSSPVTITVQASYIPVGTVLTLHVFSDNLTNQTVQTTPLAGSLASSTATATVTFPSGYALNYVKATWTTTN